MQQITEAVKYLLIINVIVFFIDQSVGLDFLALYYPGSTLFQPFQIITHMFMHGSVMHLFFNMFALYMFGAALESRWGAGRFLFFYFFCGLGAVFLHELTNYIEISNLQGLFDAFQMSPTYDNFNAFFKTVPLDSLNPEYKNAVDELGVLINGEASAVSDQAGKLMQQYVDLKLNIPTVGASGAVYGLLLAFGMLYPNVELMLIFFPVPIKAKYFIPLLMVGELFMGINQFSWDNIAHFAHLGGALFGFLLVLYWKKSGEQV